jgi:hypothetical protein
VVSVRILSEGLFLSALLKSIPSAVLTTVEVVGWAGRLWSHYRVLNSNPFIMQICT